MNDKHSNLMLQENNYPHQVRAPAPDCGAWLDAKTQELLRLVEDLVIAWVDNGEGSREASSERIRARKALEFSMISHIEASARQLAEMRIANASYNNRISEIGRSLSEAKLEEACSESVIEVLSEQKETSRLEIELLKAQLDDVRKDSQDAKRYRYWRETTKAVRDDSGENRIECTPEELDVITDAAIKDQA